MTRRERGRADFEALCLYVKHRGLDGVTVLEAETVIKLARIAREERYATLQVAPPRHKRRHSSSPARAAGRKSRRKRAPAACVSPSSVPRAGRPSVNAPTRKRRP